MMGFFLPGAGAATSLALAMNTSTFLRTKQWTGLRKCSSLGVASNRRSVNIGVPLAKVPFVWPLIGGSVWLIAEHDTGRALSDVVLKLVALF
jgi:galactitol-specific phosphotransferase system IIB component